MEIPTHIKKEKFNVHPTVDNLLWIEDDYEVRKILRSFSLQYGNISYASETYFAGSLFMISWNRYVTNPYDMYPVGDTRTLAENLAHMNYPDELRYILHKYRVNSYRYIEIAAISSGAYDALKMLLDEFPTNIRVLGYMAVYYDRYNILLMLKRYGLKDSSSIRDVALRNGGPSTVRLVRSL